MNPEPIDRQRIPEYSRLSNEELVKLLGGERAGGTGFDPSSLKEELVERNVGLVKSIALKFLNSGEPLEDLIQAGYIGLLNAAANFDLAKETRFSTYASYLIQGEIRHYIRDRHSTIRIPQWAQAMNRRIKEAEEAFFQEEGRPPKLGELAERLSLTEEQLAALLRGREAMTYVSIDQERRGTDPSPDSPSIEGILTESTDLSDEVRVRILVAIDRLNEMQRRIIHGLFYQGKSQSEVGKDLGLSQRQISRMKDRILEEIKEGLLRPGGELNGTERGGNEERSSGCRRGSNSSRKTTGPPA